MVTADSSSERAELSQNGKSPSRRFALFGWVFPAVVAVLFIAVAYSIGWPPAVAHGVALGVTLAVLQAYFSTAALLWAWHRPYFWWVWGGGILFRFVIFAAVAFVVYRYTNLSLVSTMASMVVSTTLFLVVESATCLKG